jgi:asparagine synthase (glutamine-hydrolysing)
MCGILGQFSFAEQSNIEELLDEINALRHRGPDDGAWWQEGAFFLAHRRLSIIDLNSGRQPMASADGRFVITFNGEIYNYIELREELRSLGRRFQTESDTEVILQAYDQWGRDMPVKLKGMFAFGIADRLTRQLFLARDRFGEKPLLYVDHPSGVAFASEMRPLTALTSTSRAIDESALAAFMCLNYVPGDATMVRAVRRVAPASWRLYGAHGLIATSTYWDPRKENREFSDLDEEDAAEQLEHLLDQSVRIAIRSDVPVGAFLSSGIDSSLVAMRAQRFGRLSHAYCLSMPDRSYSEWDGASKTAAQLGIPISRVDLQPDALSNFLQMVEHADDPLADSSALAVFTLSAQAALHNKVVISGDGGDELFGGYLTYQATLWHEMTIARLPMPVRHAIAWAAGQMRVRETKVAASYKMWRFLRAAKLPSNIAHYTWNGTWLPEEASSFLRGACSRTVLEDLARRHQLSQKPGVRELQLADIADYLPNDILAKTDRMSMAHGLEVRSPFLDPDLFTFALSLPARMKVRLTGPTKRILRRVATKQYGPRLAKRGKQGFSIPIHAWLREPGRELVSDLLSPASVASIGLLDSDAVQEAARAHFDGKRSLGFELWGLMVLVAWYRARIARPRMLNLHGDRPRRVEVPPLATAG